MALLASPSRFDKHSGADNYLSAQPLPNRD
jgi:hypothetical protein